MTLTEVLAAHRVMVKRGRYWVASCTGCDWTTPTPMGFRAMCLEAHEKHQAEMVAAAGLAVVEQRTITTYAEMNRLPIRSVVVTAAGNPLIHGWERGNWAGTHTAEFFPVTVVWTPAEVSR